MYHRARLIGAVAGTAGLFLAIQLGALALVEPFEAAGLQPVEDPDDPTNPLLYVGAILVATAVMLAAFRFDLKRLIRGGIILASAVLSWFVFTVIVPPIVSVGGINLLAAAGAIAIGAGLAIHPEWYVIDAAGIVIGAAAGGLFGITFSILPVLVLLTVLSVYDVISVYGTKHMLSLADGIMDVKVPVLLIVPVSLSYSFLDESSERNADASTSTDPVEGRPDDEGPVDDRGSAEPSEMDINRDALFIGLGDAVIPTILVASAAFFTPIAPLEVPFIALNLPALTAMLGTVVGLLVLLLLVLRGRPHAGLPLLCGGAILGYLVGALAAGLSLIEAVGLAAYL